MCPAKWPRNASGVLRLLRLLRLLGNILDRSRTGLIFVRLWLDWFLSMGGKSHYG